MRQLKISKTITNRDGSLGKYIREYVRVRVNEDSELAQRIKQGDRTALDKLVRANLRIVVSVAKEYQNQGISLPDLLDAGKLGLIKAAEKFGETRGITFFSFFPEWWIRQSIIQALAEQPRIVRLRLNQVGSLNKITKAFSKFEQENERKPSADELAEQLDLTPDKVSDAKRVSGRHISMDAPFAEGEDNSLIDVLEDSNSPSADKALKGESLACEIDRSLSTLSELEAEIINDFFGIGCQKMTLEEIGVKFGLTCGRVCQIIDRSLSTLSELEAEIINDFFGIGCREMKLEEIGVMFGLSRECVRQIKKKAIRRLRLNTRSKLLKSYIG